MFLYFLTQITYFLKVTKFLTLKINTSIYILAAPRGNKTEFYDQQIARPTRLSHLEAKGHLLSFIYIPEAQLMDTLSSFQTKC